MNDAFHWTYHGQIILFKGWITDSAGAYIGTLIFVFFMGLFSEFLTSYRHSLNYDKSQIEETTALINSDTEGSPATQTSSIVKTWTLFRATHYWKTITHIIQYVINYFIMLMVMSFNAGIGICALGGIGTGYFFFGKRRVADQIAEEELCH
ncbi:hypothetical protein SAMD00019534_040980 [Acytostelium subglobosum LB1]|uniref:hypothetical protein n=1 Tax=Acytostelium subglobosum LB1 TaxID=1410327 RepID=UPI000644E2AF|nr:hypothetical protein SAMD00019534_040980 [Acytostelium subglobosum LB1]GAM20923.1 hypothetical protein SAMD00019534_040980 [Acytostelium subglobosum LB1]|eukprot:XP_012756057.1 hypothetical protein SAMD00019534_040980 [Acytostelium subglobosum LB1]